MLKFIVEVRINANAPKDNETKNIFMHNVEDVIQRGLNSMTVPDWTATVIDIEEEDD